MMIHTHKHMRKNPAIFRRLPGLASMAMFLFQVQNEQDGGLTQIFLTVT